MENMAALVAPNLAVTLRSGATKGEFKASPPCASLWSPFLVGGTDSSPPRKSCRVDPESWSPRCMLGSGVARGSPRQSRPRGSTRHGGCRAVRPPTAPVIETIWTGRSPGTRRGASGAVRGPPARYGDVAASKLPNGWFPTMKFTLLAAPIGGRSKAGAIPCGALPCGAGTIVSVIACRAEPTRCPPACASKPEPTALARHNAARRSGLRSAVDARP
jgi:hypothetical protein